MIQGQKEIRGLQEQIRVIQLREKRTNWNKVYAIGGGIFLVLNILSLIYVFFVPK